MPDRATHKLNGHILASTAFLVLAVAGWAGFAYAARTSMQQREELTAQMQRLQKDQDQLRLERDQVMTEQRERSALAAEVTYLKNRVGALEADVKVAVQERDQARVELTAARQAVAAGQEQAAQAEEAENTVATGATRKKTRFRSSRRSRSR